MSAFTILSLRPMVRLMLYIVGQQRRAGSVNSPRETVLIWFCGILVVISYVSEDPVRSPRAPRDTGAGSQVSTTIPADHAGWKR